MAICSIDSLIRNIAILLVVSALLASTSIACYGPKLHVAYSQDTTQTLMYEIIRLYLHEKTGVETLPVIIADAAADTDADLDAAAGGVTAAIVDDKADIALLSNLQTKIQIKNQRKNQTRGRIDFPDHLTILYGDRLVDDLQFTTALSALKKLFRILTPEEFGDLKKIVKNGVPVKKAVRRLLFDKGWI